MNIFSPNLSVSFLLSHFEKFDTRIKALYTEICDVHSRYEEPDFIFKSFDEWFKEFADNRFLNSKEIVIAYYAYRDLV